MIFLLLYVLFSVWPESIFYACIIFRKRFSPQYIYLYNGSIYKLKCDSDNISLLKCCYSTEKQGSCMQAVAIILQFIWFLSNQTDETRYHPEQWNENQDHTAEAL